MTIKDPIKATGDVLLTVIGADGKLKERREIKNLVVTVGRNFIASRMRGATPAVMSHMALGSGNTAAAAGNTALVAELGRAALDSTGGTGNQVIYTATFGPGVGTGAVAEAGVFNAGAAGDMLARTVFSVVNKAADDTIVLTWTVTING
ncbi:phage tail protein [Xenophilus sp. Marseille-Q4582]|uniref:phage tail protein n=1 Tax=Xenophilus sp. Marseille-Q4582 TaxID=2866600 RepID=UPI001CE3F9E8|nr:phage tail protein [Xenophilus sp. Marseille-Q4582]